MSQHGNRAEKHAREITLNTEAHEAKMEMQQLNARRQEQDFEENAKNRTEEEKYHSHEKE